MRRRATRWTLLAAIGLFVGLVLWLGAHPETTSPWLSRLATRHLLAGAGGSLRFAAYEGDLVHGVTLIDAVFELADDSGGRIAVGVDRLELGYDFGDLLRQPYRLRRVVLVHPDVRLVLGDGDGGGGDARMVRLQVADLRILDGALTVSDPGGRLQEEVRDLAWRGGLELDEELRLTIDDGAMAWLTHETALMDLTGALTLRDGDLTVEQISARVNEAEVLASGVRRSNGNLDLSIQARNAAASEVEDLIDMTLGFDARGDVILDLASRGDTLDFDVDFDGVLEGYEFREFSGRATLTPRYLDWHSLAGRLNGALVSGRGRFDVTETEDVIFHVTGSVADVDLSTGLIPDTEMPPTDGWGEIELWRREAQESTLIRGWLRDGYVADVPFDSLHVLVAGDARGVTFHSLDLRHRATTARLEGRVDLEGEFLGRLDVEARDLAQLPEAWPVPELRGALSLGGEVSGNDPVYDFAGRAQVAEAGLGRLGIGPAQVDLIVADALGAPSVGFEARGEDLEAGGVPLGGFRLAGEVTPEWARLLGFRSARGDTVLGFRGEASFRDGEAEIHVADLALDLEGRRWSMPRDLRISAGPGRLEVAPVEFSSEQGHLHTALVWDRPAGVLDGWVDVERLDLDLVNPFLAEPVLNGTVSARCQLAGSPDEPLLDLRGRLSGADLPLARLDSVFVDVRFRQGVLDVRELDVHCDHGRVSAQGSVAHPGAPLDAWWPGASLDLRLDVPDGDFAFIDQFAMPALERIAGRFSGTVDIGGTTLEPELEGALTAEPFHVHWLHLDRLEGLVAYDSQQLSLGDLRGVKGGLGLTGRIEVPLLLDFMSEPVSPLDGPLYMSVTIPDGSDLRPLATMTNAFVSSGGTGGLDLVISGPADHPYYSGRVRVRDGACVIRRLNEVYSDISCEGIWQGDVLTISDIRGREGLRGTVNGSGSVIFNGLEMESFEVDLAADRFLVASIPDVRALIRSDALKLTGVKVGPDSLIVPRFTGDLEVIEARYTGDFSEQAGVVDPRASTVAPDWLADLDIVAPPRTVNVLNTQMELDLGGDVHLIRDEGGLDVRGDLTIDQGRLPVFNNDFRVTRGSVEFVSGRGVIPDLDILAETQVRLPAVQDDANRRLERVWITLTGPAEGPTVTFASESGYPRQSIERMLLGFSPHDTQDPTGDVLRRGTVAAGFNLLEREVAQQLDVVDTFDIIGGRERADGSMQTLVGVGKYIGRDLYVRFAQAVTDQDREVLLEYQITDHLMLQSEINRRLDEALGNTTYSVDLKYRFEY